MKLSLRAVAFTAAIVWGLSLLIVGVQNLLWPPYGKAFLDVMSSIYPGYKQQGTTGDVIVATLYAVVDGGIGGFITAWIYNLFAK
jgi:hypothetical protein